MATAAGQASLADTKTAGGHGEMLASEQLGAIRLTHWPAFGVEDQRRTGLRLRAAREWIVQAANDADFRSVLRDRKRRIFIACPQARPAGRPYPPRMERRLERRHARRLELTGERLETRLGGATDSSPVFKALLELSAKDDGARLNWLGPNMSAINGCMHPHFAPQMPYEEFERYMLPNRMAQRASEFKLYLAEYLERAGTPPSFLPLVAEPAARRVLSSMKMADFRDWPAALDAFTTISDEMIDGVLANQ